MTRRRRRRRCRFRGRCTKDGGCGGDGGRRDRRSLCNPPRIRIRGGGCGCGCSPPLARSSSARSSFLSSSSSAVRSFPIGPTRRRRRRRRRADVGAVAVSQPARQVPLVLLLLHPPLPLVERLAPAPPAPDTKFKLEMEAGVGGCEHGERVGEELVGWNIPKKDASPKMVGFPSTSAVSRFWPVISCSCNPCVAVFQHVVNARTAPVDCGRFGDIPFRKENCKSHPGYCPPPPPIELPADIGEFWIRPATTPRRPRHCCLMAPSSMPRWR